MKKKFENMKVKDLLKINEFCCSDNPDKKCKNCPLYEINPHMCIKFYNAINILNEVKFHYEDIKKTTKVKFTKEFRKGYEEL